MSVRISASTAACGGRFCVGRMSSAGSASMHRKQWLLDRLEFLTGVFEVDVLGFAVMSNHRFGKWPPQLAFFLPLRSAAHFAFSAIDRMS